VHETNVRHRYKITFKKKITYSDNIFLIGSSVFIHIGHRLMELKFSVLNPNVFYFDPVSVGNSLAYIDNKQYEQADLFHLKMNLAKAGPSFSMFSGMVAE